MYDIERTGYGYRLTFGGADGEGGATGVAGRLA